MSTTWNGSALLTRFSQKFGLTDTTSLARVLEWMNEIQEDICGEFNYPFLKTKLVKTIAIGAQEVELSVDIPAAATAELLNGGALTPGSTYEFKVSFILLDENGLERDSIESEAGPASTSQTATDTKKNVKLTNVPLFPTSGKTAHRRIYMSKDSGCFFLVATIEDNTTTTKTIGGGSISVGTVEVPEYSRVSVLADDDPTIDSLNVKLLLTTTDKIKAFDPNQDTTGTPFHYSRLDDNRIFIYPKPSVEIVLTYYVYKVPAYIFDDASRVIQMSPKLKKALDAGVYWKGLEYKDSDGQETKLRNYEGMKTRAIESFSKKGGKFGTVQEVC